MTIQKLISGENVNFLQVNVLKELNSTQYIVGDATGMAIMTIEEASAKFVEVGKGLKMVKPSKVDENNIAAHPKFNPQKTKATDLEMDFDEIDRLSTQGTNISSIRKGINFSEIETDFGQNAMINQVLAYVTSASRTIEGKYGAYQICNLVDYDGNTLAINLYKSNINKLEIHKAYKLEKIKKTAIKSDNGKLRLATTNFTKILDATTGEADLFADVKIADKKLQGTCLMFNNLNIYKSCKKHMTRLDDGICGECGQTEMENQKADFRCSLVIFDPNAEDDNMTEITIFKRHLNVNIDVDCNEEKLIQILENSIVDKECEIHYNENGDDNNVAVKLTLIGE